MNAENSASLSEINYILNYNISQNKRDAMPIILFHIREKDAGQEIDLFLFQHHWVHHRSSLMTDYAGLRRALDCGYFLRMSE